MTPENDRIAALEAENARLRKALTVYADTLCEFSSAFDGCGRMVDSVCFGCGARAVLEGRDWLAAIDTEKTDDP